jgi:biotin carboxyl carrier protein
MTAGIAAAYLHRAELRQLQAQQQLWAQGDNLSRQLHGSLDPRQVAYLAANQGRLLLGCDQVGVGLRHLRSVGVEAISGANTVEARSPLVQAMRELMERVLAWGEKVVYHGKRDDSLPPAVLKALDAYLALSNSRLLLVVPLLDERERLAERPAQAILLVESFTPTLCVEQLEARLPALAKPSAAALYNALAYRRASATAPTRTWNLLCDWTRGKRGRTLGLIVTLAALLIGALTFIPAPLRVEARGQLLPRDRQIVYATRPGKVVELKTYHGDQVQKGQELLFLEDLESQLKVEQLTVKIAYAEQRLAALAEQLNKAGSNEDRNNLVKERINQEYEMRKAAVERDILLQESRSPRKTPLTAPLAGKLVTFDAREQLVGKAVKPGDPLVRIARVQGPWEIELNLPEAALAPIREGLRRAGDGTLEVNLLLASQPLRSYKGRLRWEGLGGETIVKDNAVVLPVRVEIVDPELMEQLGSLPVGLEVRAKIGCGSRALGTVWFGDLLEFVYERLLF